MAKGFPFFKFTATEWLTGDIVFEDFELQGVFINVCAIYWNRDGKVSFEELKKRLKTDRLTELTDRFISVNDGLVKIKFLDEQLNACAEISDKNSKNGRLGGRPSHKQSIDIEGEKPNGKRPHTERLPKKSKEEEEVEKKREEVEVEEAAPKQNLDVHATYETVKRATVDDVLFIEQGAMAAGGDKEQFKKFCQKKLDKMQAAGIVSRYKISGIRGFMIEDFEKLTITEKKNSFATAPKIKNLT